MRYTILFSLLAFINALKIIEAERNSVKYVAITLAKIPKYWPNFIHADEF